MNLETSKETATKAVKTVTGTVAETTTTATNKAKEYTEVAAGRFVDYSTAATDSVKGATDTATSRASEYGTAAVATIADTATEIIDQGRVLAQKGFVRVKEFQVGDKKVGERAQATVETVTDKIDVDQIQDQVAKLRHQMEGVLSTWKDTFRPATAPTAAPKPTAKKPAVKKPATKATTATKPAAKKPAAKKATTKASTTKTTTARKPAAKKATPKASTTKASTTKTTA